MSNAGDVDGDGIDDLFVSAIGAAPNGLSGAGSVFVYSGASGALLHRFDGPSVNAGLGYSVSGAGDVNDDGFEDVLIGASFFNQGGPRISSAFVYSFSPFMIADANSVSAASGGIVSFDLDFPDSAALDGYKILISTSGTGPIHFGVDIPLTLDSMVRDTFYGNYPFSTYSNLHGTLDVAGNAAATITIPAGLNINLIGRTFYFAAIANQPGNLPEYSSIAVPVTIVP